MTTEPETIDLRLDPIEGLVGYEGEYPPNEDIFRVPVEEYHTYNKLIQSTHDLEDNIRAHYRVESLTLPEDLASLQGILSDQELKILASHRAKLQSSPLASLSSVDLVEVLHPTQQAQDSEAPVVPPVPGLPPCTAPRSGGIHSPARYFLKEDKTVDGQCRCGQVLKNVKCPHRHQRLNKRTKAVECKWCGGVIIAGTGVGDPVMDVSLLQSVDIHKFEGTVS